MLTKTELLGAKRVPFREVYSQPEVFLHFNHFVMFGFREGFGYLEFVTLCQFINSLFRSLGSIKLGFISEADLENY
jgi:hypothetical protein